MACAKLNSDLSNKTLSIVVPCHNEALNLERLILQLSDQDYQGLQTQIILVDDGSEDQTWAIIESICKVQQNVIGLRLSRNFGHQYALFAGICRAEGAAVVMMDGDFQHPVYVIPKLIKEWHSGAQIVNTIRHNSGKESWFKRWSSDTYYKLFSFLSGVELNAGMADFRLLDRKVVEALTSIGEEGLFLRGLVKWVGYSTATIEFRAEERFAGNTSYNFRKMLKFAWTGITSFSIIPLRISILVGLITSFLAFAELMYAVTVKLAFGTTTPGWASAVSIISLLFGILFIMLGVLGEYIGRILVEVRGRPRYLIAREVGGLQPIDATNTPCPAVEQTPTTVPTNGARN